MRPDEIQMGDWLRLRYKSYPDEVQVVKDFRVEQVRHIGWTDGSLCVYGKEGNVSEVSRVEPIPVTISILIKNGFAEARHSKRPSYQFIDGNTYAGWWNGRLNMRYNPFPGKRPSNYIHIDCRFVHQLQHAFRLAGIEKEIVL